MRNLQRVFKVSSDFKCRVYFVGEGVLLKAVIFLKITQVNVGDNGEFQPPRVYYPNSVCLSMFVLFVIQFKSPTRKHFVFPYMLKIKVPCLPCECMY